MQIRLRLTIQFSVVVFSFLLVCFAAIYFYTYQNNRQQFHQRLDDKAVTSATLLLRIDQVDSSLLKAIDRAKRDVLFMENITIYDSTDREVYTNNDTVNFVLPAGLLGGVRRDRVRYFTLGDFEVSGIVFNNKKDEYVILAGAKDTNGDRMLANLRTLLIGLLGIAMIIVILAGWIYAGRALKPINVLISEIQSITERELDKRLQKRKHNDEIGKLIHIFNDLLARIDRAFELQRSFVSNVSHELKNPLTKITSQLEVTLLNERTKDEYKETISSVLDDTRELNILSTSLLDLASVHEESRTFSMTQVRVDEILWEVLEHVKSLNPAYETEIVNLELPDKSEKLSIYGNPFLLRTALINIVENACKFSFDHKARVSLVCSNHLIHIRISDQGPGMNDDDLQNIFQPFFRADRTSKIKGYGIGLSLSQRIIRIYDGKIEVNSKLGVGTDVNVILKAIVTF